MKRRSAPRRGRRYARIVRAAKRANWSALFLSGGATVGFAALIICTFFLTNFQQTLLRSSHVAAVVSAMLVDLANGDRAAQSLTDLQVDPLLVAVAQAKANDMAEKGYFAHVSPEGKDPWYWFDAMGYDFAYAGENLAVDFRDSAAVESAWMKSPLHRENILNPRFTHIGIATAVGEFQGHSTVFVVQEFGTPRAGATAEDQTAKERLEHTPSDPAEMAVAHVDAAQGTEREADGFSAPAVAGAASPPVLAVAREAPVWGYIFAFPEATLRYSYLFIVAAILLALVVETGFELRQHHRKVALRAAALFLLVLVLFSVSTVLWSDPILTP